MNYQKFKCKLNIKEKNMVFLLHSVLITNIKTLTFNR